MVSAHVRVLFTTLLVTQCALVGRVFAGDETPVKIAASVQIPAEPAADGPHVSATPVEVVTLDGQRIRGSLLDLGPDSVTLLVQGERRTLTLRRVARIDTRRDSLRNGFLIGAAVLGGWCSYICGQGLPDRSELPIAVAVNAAFGGLIGMGIDALNPHHQTLYHGTPSSAAARVGTRFTVSW